MQQLHAAPYSWQFLNSGSLSLLKETVDVYKRQVIRHENAANINSCLRRIIDEYEEILASIGYLSTISCTELIHIITYEQKKKGITFQTIAREYLSFMAGEERHKSYSLYKIASERFIKYMKGDFPLIQLTPLHVQEFAENLYKEGLTDTTISCLLYTSFHRRSNSSTNITQIA